MAARPRFVVALVRHGDYEQPERVPSALLPHPLTAKGREQARELATTLLDEARAHALTLDPTIDCSSLLRAWQTATLMAARLSEQTGSTFEVAEFDTLVERSLGAAANLTIEQIADAVASDPRLPPLPPDWKGHPNHRLPFIGAESLMQAGARVATHLQRRAQAHAVRPMQDLLVVVVGHGSALRHAAVCLGALEPDRVGALSMNHCGHVLLEQHGDGRWTQIGGRWKVRATPSND
jgi:2,3-bisphosphoglycerate-dependent phosphoglycerate mutase